jgi:DNA polymerase V
VGLGPTKTLAKLANFAAKKWPQTAGVLDLSDPVRREKLMRLVPVNEVWGIGSRTTAKLKQLGIHTVWDLATQPSEHMQAQFNITLARTVLELNAIPCLELEEMPPDKQQIICSRSFSQRLTTLDELAQALAKYCTTAAEKLRHQQSVTGCITVFIRTNSFATHTPQYQRTASFKLHSPTQDTRIIIGIARRLLVDIFKSGYRYHKCGVQLSQIQPASSPGQLELFDIVSKNQLNENRLLMQTVDQINRRFPKSIAVASVRFNKTGKPKSARLSQGYTTNWRELVNVKC